jgi:hypothetical protein
VLPPPTGVAPATYVKPPEAPIAPAEIHFSDGKLQVVAHGSSLNQILREIGRLTSITIQGAASDERVYGTYGPARCGEVLSSLLDGTGTNMLLRESTATRPGELILSARSGGASPPNPNSESFDNSAASLPPRQSYQRPPSYPAPVQPIPPGIPQPPPPANTGTSNGPQTPEQIYQQLQRIQQSQPHP